MRSISDLFRGRDDVHGYYGLLGNKPSDRGKRTGEAATRRHPVTADLWQLHLDGKQRLGIVPVQKDRTCWWFCLDVDFYQETGLHEDLAARIEELHLPLVMTRSKSGGAHLWCFLTEPMDCGEVIAVALSFKKRLNLPKDHIDIFPAQAKAEDVGNWMNMPYFGDQCHGTGPDGTGDQTLIEFVEYANHKAVHPSDLGIIKKSKTKVAAVKTPASQLPPCIQHMLAEGIIPEGYRDNGLTQFAIAYKKAYPDDWEERIRETNQELCDPPLDSAQVRKIITSVRTKDFGYLCDKIKEVYCDASACKKLDFGVKGPDNNAIAVDNITKIEGETPLYKITMYNKTFTIDLDTLFNYQLFRKAVLGACNKYLPNMKNDDWAEVCQGLIDLADLQEAAPDTQMAERVVTNFRRFAAGSTSEGLDVALTRGLPFYNAGYKHIVFRGDDFMQLIDRNLKIDRDRTWVYMREAGCVQNNYTVAGKSEKLWCFVVEGDIWFDPNEGERA
jgi:hypothetical protein